MMMIINLLLYAVLGCSFFDLFPFAGLPDIATTMTISTYFGQGLNFFHPIRDTSTYSIMAKEV